MSETKLSRKLKCLHCGNVAPMEVLECANTVQSFEEEVAGAPDWHTIDWEADIFTGCYSVFLALMSRWSGRPSTRELILKGLKVHSIFCIRRNWSSLPVYRPT